MFRSPIKAFLFDLGNVVFEFSHARMYAQLATLVGTEPARLRDHLEAADVPRRYETGLISTAELQKLLEDTYDLPLTRPALVQAVGDIFSEKVQTTALVRRLKAAGHRLVIVSNTCEAHMEWAEASFDCFALFDAKIYSYEVKAMKPDALFYRAAADAAGCSPSEALFIDDLAANIDGAAAYGFQTHHFGDAGALGEALARAGALVVKS